METVLSVRQKHYANMSWCSLDNALLSFHKPSYVTEYDLRPQTIYDKIQVRSVFQLDWGPKWEQELAFVSCPFLFLLKDASEERDKKTWQKGGRGPTTKRKRGRIVPLSPLISVLWAFARMGE